MYVFHKWDCISLSACLCVSAYLRVVLHVCVRVYVGRCDYLCDYECACVCVCVCVCVCACVCVCVSVCVCFGEQAATCWKQSSNWASHHSSIISDHPAFLNPQTKGQKKKKREFLNKKLNTIIQTGSTNDLR